VRNDDLSFGTGRPAWIASIFSRDLPEERQFVEEKWAEELRWEVRAGLMEKAVPNREFPL